MDEDTQGELFARPAPETEGQFDEQLMLPWPAVRAPQPLRTVVKRDGRQEPFDKQKISSAIVKAAEAAGADDAAHAESLASAVTIYLAKRLRGDPPTVDQVHDAVERVLIQMGHAETALTYARYRDRRARIRRLRKGDMRQLLAELREAREERESLAGHGEDALLVRTRQGEQMSWDRGKITAALMRETGLEEPLAEMIAIEVETQIERARITSLTVSLVRELVDAKLVEHGFWEHRERYRRLGVSLYDTERILQGAAAPGPANNPAATDRVLAQAVKREFALAQVYSAQVADAHQRGDIHLHHLGLTDRLHSATLTLDFIARHGIGLPGAPDFAGPARRADTLLAQMVKGGAALMGYFAKPLIWEAANFHFAPYLREFDENEVNQFAQMLVYEYAYRALMRSEPLRPTVVEVCWKAPPELAAQEAVGPGGEPTGQPYRAYEHTAQQLAWALFDVLRRGGADGASFPAPLPRVRIDDTFAKAPGRGAFLRQVAKVTAERKNVHYRFGRANQPRPVDERRHIALQQVTLNLPRAAYAAGKEDKLYAEIDRLVRVAVQAMAEKRAFLESLLAHEAQGPLALLAVERDGTPLVNFDEAEGLVAVDGLNECVQYLVNAEPHRSPEAAALGERILEYLAGRCAALGARERLRLVPTQNNDLFVGQRFATLDLQAFPKSAAATVKTVESTQELRYTPGARLNPAHGLNPIEAARIEGRFHTWLGAGALTEIALPEHAPSAETIADFIMKVHAQTGNSRICFV